MFRSTGPVYPVRALSIREIRTPHHGPAPFTLGILIVVIVVKEILFRYVNRVGHNVESTAVQTDAWHHRSDALTSAAAFIGISIALIGGEGYEPADDWAALGAPVGGAPAAADAPPPQRSFHMPVNWPVVIPAATALAAARCCAVL